MAVRRDPGGQSRTWSMQTLACGASHPLSLARQRAMLRCRRARNFSHDLTKTTEPVNSSEVRVNYLHGGWLSATLHFNTQTQDDGMKHHYTGERHRSLGEFSCSIHAPHKPGRGRGWLWRRRDTKLAAKGSPIAANPTGYTGIVPSK